ncbi:LysR family transcriptional regulator [Paraburkholderia hospita]|uniref:LysR family transcriptional regulator n=1 Tax=Paraburkholderia hospita TaxID=169430 RepID=UPI000B344E91|nr:LysR family transcriptional regulator [Paraburkholderia hospita]OUL72733.1 LysR family transcriptional regulator [Paraburkholderia hospita]
MSITLRQLRYFVAAAELGQLSRAAMELNISQSAVTIAIRDLEQAVGRQLLQRGPQGVDLTDAGRRFLEHSYAILAGVDEALRATNNESAIESSVRVAASYTLLGYFLPYHLQRIATLYPGLSIRLHEARRDEIEEGLLADRYDIAVLLADNVASSGLAVERIFASTRRLWVASNHPLLEKRSVTFADVAKEPFIMLTVDEAADTAMRYWSKTDYQPHVILQTSSVEAVRSMVANGSGVAILSDMVYRPWSLEGKRIETITLANPVPSMAGGIAHARDREITPGMRVFLDYFRETFNSPYLPHAALRQSRTAAR